MSDDPYCTFTVQAQRCCLKIIAVAHALYYHRCSIDGDSMQHHMEEADLAMKDAVRAARIKESTVKEAVAACAQNATSVPSELSPSG